MTGFRTVYRRLAAVDHPGWGIDRHCFYLVGPAGTVQLVFGRWTKPSDGRLYGDPDLQLEDRSGLWPVDLGLHYPTPQGPGAYHSGPCEWVPGEGDCWFDGSGLAARDLLQAWIREGSDSIIWAGMAGNYQQNLDAGVNFNDFRFLPRPILSYVVGSIVESSSGE
jgi:hypothetical protein